MSQPRIAVPAGAACVALLASGFPSGAAPVDEDDTARDAGPGDRAVSASASASAQQSAIQRLSIENVSGFVAVRVRHRGAYWDGRTDIRLSADGPASYPYRVRVQRGESDATFGRAGSGDWKCSGSRVSADDASQETLVVIPRSCFDGSAQSVRAKATTHSGGSQTSSKSKGGVSRTNKPNVVVVMADDMRDDEMDGPWMQQTREQIGDSGVRFQNSFAPLPLCAPARASFLTGQYAHNHGVWSHSAPYGFSVFHDKETLPVWLRRAGYDTFMLGKYINGYGKPEMPAPNGGKSENYIPPGWSDWRASLDNKGTYNYLGTHLNNNGSVQSLAGRYQTTAYGKIAANAIRKRSKSGNPFFMYLSYTAPHHGAPQESDDPGDVTDHEDHEYRIKTPAVPDKERGRWDEAIPRAPGTGGERDMSDKPEFMQELPGLTASEQEGVRELARQRAESEGVLDDSVARVMKELRKRGQLDNTYVMFTSDNGYFLGEHRMRQGKTLPYEPSLRTPTMMRGPGIPAGESRSDPFLSIDFAPTILRMAGLSTNQKLPIDGRSMFDVAREGDTGWSRPVLTETGPSTVPTLMDLSGDTVGADPNQSSTATRVRGVRVPGMLFAETSGREPELYDLVTDPGEVRSVLGETRYDDARTSLDGLLQDLQACLGEECRRPLPKELRGPREADEPKDGEKPKDDTKSREGKKPRDGSGGAAR